MKTFLKLIACTLIIATLMLACQKELECYYCDSNNPPVANAGNDQVIILPKDSTVLDGTASVDPDGNLITYKWVKISGPVSSNLITASSAKTIVKMLSMGIYKFELTVTDNGNLSSKDTVQVIVNDPGINQPPIAIAGNDQTIIAPTDSVLLDGNLSFDPDGTIATYQWTMLSGPLSFNILSPNTAQTKVKSLSQGVYQFELKVTDNSGLSAKDTIQVMVDNPAINQPPVSCSGADQTINLPTNSVILNGSCSADPDNNITTYQWTKISGPSSFTIANSNTVLTQVVNLIQGVYQFELKVTDAGGLFSKDTVQVMVNAPPVTYTCGDTNRPHINTQLIPMGTLSQARFGVAVVAAGNKIFFAGGLSNSGIHLSIVDIYDLGSQTWSTAQLNTARTGPAAITVGNKIFFAGGEVGDGTCASNAVDIYNVTTNTWSASTLSISGNMIVPATVGNKVLFTGGFAEFCGPWDRTTRVDIYDLTTNSWSIAKLGSVRSGYHAAVTINNKVYISGGESWPPNIVPGDIPWASQTIDIYDNATNSWSISSLTEGKMGHAGVAVNDKIYWAGGETGSSPYMIGSCLVEIMNVNTGSISIQSLSRPGWSTSVVKNNQIIFYSGDDKFDLYDVMTDKWSIGVLPVKFSGESQIISVNNKIYILNGINLWRLEF